MCGIAGSFGPQEVPDRAIEECLRRLDHRGPDASGTWSGPSGNNDYTTLVHTRLAIIDLDQRSNQPFQGQNHKLIFNGEIYNYLEIRESLVELGYTFETASDTEVLSIAYQQWGTEAFARLEGMWAVAIWDTDKQELILCRDRFGEKPLYYLKHGRQVYFASEPNALFALSGQSPEPNINELCRYLFLGYKSICKSASGFFKEVKEVQPGQMVTWSSNLPEVIRDWYQLEYRPNHALTIHEAVDETQRLLKESVRLRLRADVPIAYCLSGGIDSGGLVSIASQDFAHSGTAYSILSNDERYDERVNIYKSAEHAGLEVVPIHLHESRLTLDKLSETIKHRAAPVITITYFIHGLISEAASQDGNKIVFSGTAADELFTGYYDHFLLHLQEMERIGRFDEFEPAWLTHVKPITRNKILQNSRLYIDHPNEHRHIFDESDRFKEFAKVDFHEAFFNCHYTDSLLRNRMQNELQHEATRIILREDDYNSMRYSIENRSPYLDSKLVEFAYTIPPENLIIDGQGKFILREALQGILHEDVRTDRRKRGFNAPIAEIFDLNDRETKERILEPSSPVFEIIDSKVIETLLKNPTHTNSESKFLFNFINAKLFLEHYC